MAAYPTPAPATGLFAASRAYLEQMITRLGDAQMMSCTEQALEQYVTTAGRDLQQLLIQNQLDARAAAEVRHPQVAGADQVVRHRAETGHTRLVATTVGRVQVTRLAYRAAGAPNLYPADARLGLPDRLYSFPLQRHVVHEVATGSLREAREALVRTTGQQVGTRQLMEIAVDAARDVRAFYQPTNPSPPPASEDLLVLTSDATGVNMIPADLRGPTRPTGPAGPRPPSARLSRRDRTGRTRMATVTAIYDATPAPRSGADVLPADAVERAARRPGPKAVNRRMDASLRHGTTHMTAALFGQAQARDPHHRRRWIVLVDGANHQLDCIHQQAHAHGVRVDIIIDFIHVLEYLWGAAEDLHPTQPGRAGFVHRTARDLLDGHVAQVITELRTQLHDRIQAGSPAPRLERTIAYLQAKQPYLGYDVALALGWPIATGVIEGACRYLVKDRMDITGARWSLPGAEAVLLLRAAIANGDFEQYWPYHLRQDYQRTHASQYKDLYELAA